MDNFTSEEITVTSYYLTIFIVDQLLCYIAIAFYIYIMFIIWQNRMKHFSNFSVWGVMNALIKFYWLLENMLLSSIHQICWSMASI